jgi:plasmid stability protein
MRQLITRVDDELHARLKDRAASEGRSVNDLVVELLTAAVDSPRTALRRRLARRSLLLVPEPPRPVPGRNRALAATRGAGSSASAALADERGAR